MSLVVRTFVVYFMRNFTALWISLSGTHTTENLSHGVTPDNVRRSKLAAQPSGKEIKISSSYQSTLTKQRGETGEALRRQSHALPKTSPRQHTILKVHKHRGATAHHDGDTGGAVRCETRQCNRKHTLLTSGEPAATQLVSTRERQQKDER